MASFDTVFYDLSPYRYYYRMTIPATTSGDPIRVSLNNVSYLVDRGLLRADYKDLRVAYYSGGSWSQIARQFDDANGLIYFSTQATHASQVTDQYIIYFGNAMESSSPSSTIIAREDDFSNSSFDTSLWYSNTDNSGSVTEGSVLTVASPVAVDAAIFGPDTTLDTYFEHTVIAKCGSVRANNTVFLGILQDSTHPKNWVSADFVNTAVGPKRRILATIYSNGTATTYYLAYLDNTDTWNYWNFSTNQWQTSYAEKNTGAGYVNVKVIVKRDSSGWKIQTWNDDTSTQDADCDYITDLKETSDDWYIYCGDEFNNFYTNDQDYKYSYYNPGYDVTPEIGKYSKPNYSDTRSIEVSHTTQDTSLPVWGSDQATGKECGSVQSLTAGTYGFVSVNMRQTGATALQTDNMWLFIYDTSGGSPNNEIMRVRCSPLAVEKSTGSYQWQDFMLWSSFVVPSAADYAFIIRADGSGSSSVALNIGCENVGTGGNAFYRDRSASAWGSWTADTAKDMNIKIYQGLPQLLERGIMSVISEDGVILEATGTPSWEATTSADNVAHLTIDDVYWNSSTGEYEVVYSSYETTIAYPTTVKRNLGVAHGSDISSLSKYDQAVLINWETTPNTVHWHSHLAIYDRTSGAMKGIMRAKYNVETGGIDRHLRGCTNSDTTWYTNEAGGGWDDDGIVAYPVPTCVDVYFPQLWNDGSDDRISAHYRVYSSGVTTALSGTIVSNLELANLKYHNIDDTDLMVGIGQSFGPYGIYQTSDGIYHAFYEAQYPLTGDSNGDYYFDTWVMHSADGWTWTPPEPFLLRDEVTGPNLGYGVGAIIDDNTMICSHIDRYWITGGTNPKINVKAAKITISISIPSSRIQKETIINEVDTWTNKLPIRLDYVSGSHNGNNVAWKYNLLGDNKYVFFMAHYRRKSATEATTDQIWVTAFQEDGTILWQKNLGDHSNSDHEVGQRELLIGNFKGSGTQVFLNAVKKVYLWDAISGNAQTGFDPYLSIPNAYGADLVDIYNQTTVIANVNSNTTFCAVFARIDDDNNSNSTVYCIDLDNGNTVWSKAMTGKIPDHVGQYGDLQNSGKDDILWTFGTEVYAFNHTDGSILWHHTHSGSEHSDFLTVEKLLDTDTYNSVIIDGRGGSGNLLINILKPLGKNDGGVLTASNTISEVVNVHAQNCVLEQLDPNASYKHIVITFRDAVRAYRSDTFVELWENVFDGCHQMRVFRGLDRLLLLVGRSRGGTDIRIDIERGILKIFEHDGTVIHERDFRMSGAPTDAMIVKFFSSERNKAISYTEELMAFYVADTGELIQPSHLSSILANMYCYIISKPSKWILNVTDEFNGYSANHTNATITNESMATDNIINESFDSTSITILDTNTWQVDSGSVNITGGEAILNHATEATQVFSKKYFSNATVEATVVCNQTNAKCFIGFAWDTEETGIYDNATFRFTGSGAISYRNYSEVGEVTAGGAYNAGAEYKIKVELDVLNNAIKFYKDDLINPASEHNASGSFPWRKCRLEIKTDAGATFRIKDIRVWENIQHDYVEPTDPNSLCFIENIFDSDLINGNGSGLKSTWGPNIISYNGTGNSPLVQYSSSDDGTSWSSWEINPEDLSESRFIKQKVTIFKNTKLEYTEVSFSSQTIGGIIPLQLFNQFLLL